MRVKFIALIAIVGCVVVVHAAPIGAEDKVPPSADVPKALSEPPSTSPTVPLDQLIDQMPDGAVVIELYKSVRTVGDVEPVNAYVKEQIIKAQSIVADIARSHAAALKSCDGAATPKTETIAI
ncbi:hypothetical protein I6F36_38570, partial [Bradyrhizobium sp. BRP19]|uniref:hypothetical protein n=1 Tax=Bradyrhizobium sp. BRP19 TaxID=2793823 RepID=UPI001CD32942